VRQLQLAEKVVGDPRGHCLPSSTGTSNHHGYLIITSQGPSKEELARWLAVHSNTGNENPVCSCCEASKNVENKEFCISPRSPRFGMAVQLLKRINNLCKTTAKTTACATEARLVAVKTDICRPRGRSDMY
jgi:hypothetical protein